MTTGNVVVDVLSQLPKPALDVRCGSGGSGCRLEDLDTEQKDEIREEIEKVSREG